jgi:hypothetical protein
LGPLERRNMHQRRKERDRHQTRLQRDGSRDSPRPARLTARIDEGLFEHDASFSLG